MAPQASSDSAPFDAGGMSTFRHVFARISAVIGLSLALTVSTPWLDAQGGCLVGSIATKDLFLGSGACGPTSLKLAFVPAACAVQMDLVEHTPCAGSAPIRSWLMVSETILTPAIELAYPALFHANSFLYIAPEAVFGPFADRGTIAIPHDPHLIGLHFFCQALFHDSIKYGVSQVEIVVPT